jgi:hypothetical protein
MGESELGVTANLLMCDKCGVDCTLYTPHSLTMSLHNSAIPYNEKYKNDVSFALRGAMSQAHMLMFRIAINKLFEWLFSRVLASHHGGRVRSAKTGQSLDL